MQLSETFLFHHKYFIADQCKHVPLLTSAVNKLLKLAQKPKHRRIGEVFTFRNAQDQLKTTIFKEMAEKFREFFDHTS